MLSISGKPQNRSKIEGAYINIHVKFWFINWHSPGSEMQITRTYVSQLFGSSVSFEFSLDFRFDFSEAH